MKKVWKVGAWCAGGVVLLVDEGPAYDPTFRFFSRFVFGHESTLRGYLEALEDRFEPGSSA